MASKNHDSPTQNLTSIFTASWQLHSYLNCLIKSHDYIEATYLMHNQIEVDLMSTLNKDFFPKATQKDSPLDKQTKSSSILCEAHTFSIVIRPMVRLTEESFNVAMTLMKRMSELDIEPDSKTV